MGRWEPNARERLVEAALALFSERGYDRTTVGEIAARAGLTERTFFRHFTDKREVLFGRSADLEKGIAQAIAAAPDDASPLEAVVGALEVLGAEFPPRRDYRARQNLIAAHPELRERELIKLAALASAIGVALRARGVPDASAHLAAEVGIAVFKTAFERWIGGPRDRDFVHHIRAAAEELTAIASGSRHATTTGRRGSTAAKRGRR